MTRALSRREWMAAVGGAGVGVAIAGTATWSVRRAFTHAPQQIVVTRHAVPAPGGPHADAPAVSLRVVQLSDLHLRAIGAREERVIAAVAGQRPDLIVFTGDSVDSQPDLEPFGEFLDLLDRGTRKLAVVGDSERAGGVDVRALARTYAARECELLVNDVAEFVVRTRRVLVTGLDDLIGGTPDPARALVGTEPTANHLLLAHCPAQRDRLRWSRVRPAATARIPQGPEVDLAPYVPRWMLSGHTHGGQIAPLGWPLLRPIGSGRYVSGWYRQAIPDMYVSRGIGTSFIPARHRAPPEIAVFDWTLL